MVSLGNAGARQVYFEQTISRLVSYWAEHEAVEDTELEVLDKERGNILRAISLAIEIPQARAHTVDLIEALHSYMLLRRHFEAWYSLLSKSIEVTKRQNFAFRQVNIKIV